MKVWIAAVIRDQGWLKWLKNMEHYIYARNHLNAITVSRCVSNSNVIIMSCHSRLPQSWKNLSKINNSQYIFLYFQIRIYNDKLSRRKRMNSDCK